VKICLTAAAGRSSRCVIHGGRQVAGKRKDSPVATSCCATKLGSRRARGVISPRPERLCGGSGGQGETSLKYFERRPLKVEESLSFAARRNPFLAAERFPYRLDIRAEAIPGPDRLPLSDMVMPGLGALLWRNAPDALAATLCLVAALLWALGGQIGPCSPPTPVSEGPAGAPASERALPLALGSRQRPDPGHPGEGRAGMAAPTPRPARPRQARAGRPGRRARGTDRRRGGARPVSARGCGGRPGLPIRCFSGGCGHPCRFGGQALIGGKGRASGVRPLARGRCAWAHQFRRRA
jgi:hypothetical protein